MRSFSPWTMRLVRLFLTRILPLFARVRIDGRQHLEGSGRLLVSNHLGWADPIWLAYAAYPRVLHQMAKKELFRSPVLAFWLRRLGAFPVDRSHPSSATIKYAAARLSQGDLVLVFPAGTRGEAQLEARRGAAVIARMARVAIVPAFYEGPRTIALSHLFSRPTVSVRFGPPILDISSGVTARRASEELTTKLDEAIQRLSDQELPPS